MQINQIVAGISICQSKYVEDLLKQFNMQGCELVSTPIVVGNKLMREDETPLYNATLCRYFIGNLMYQIATRSNIMSIVSLVSRFMHQPHE
jgi:hypothetical protein